MVEIECVGESTNTMGEGPLWDPVESILYWVDMLEKEVWSYSPSTGKTRTWPVPKEIGAFALTEQGGAVITMRDGFYFLDLESANLRMARAGGWNPDRYHEVSVDPVITDISVAA